MRITSQCSKLYRKLHQRIRKLTRIRKLHQRIRKLTRINDIFSSLYEKATRRLFTYHVRPAYAEECASVQDKSIYPRTAIMIQGPVVGHKNFTLETIRIYKKYFSEAIIILSTWDDTMQEICVQIKKEGIELILNKKPDFGGHKNINFQITSSSAGVTRANALGAEYILKTRTDQRFYHPYLLSFLHNAIKAFPLSLSSTIQKQRLIFSSASRRSEYQCQYHVSDMMIFGHISDMERYWQANMVSPDIGADDFVSEQYLMTEFLKKVGHHPTWAVEDSDDVLAGRCVILDLPLLDFYWYKYRRHQEYKYLSYEDTRWHNITFLEWLGLYTALKKEN